MAPGAESHAGLPRHPLDEDHGVELHRMAMFIFIVIVLHIAGVLYWLLMATSNEGRNDGSYPRNKRKASDESRL